MATELQITGSCWIASPLYTYGLMESPNYRIHKDFDSVFDQSGCISNNAYIDKNARVLMGRPTPIPFDTTIGTGTGLPLQWTIVHGTWYGSAIDRVTGKKCLMMDDANVYTTSSAVPEVKANAQIDVTKPYIVHMVKGEPAQDAVHDALNCYCYWILGSDDTDTISYRITQRWGEPFKLEGSTDGGVTWMMLTYTENISDSEAYLNSHNRSFDITVLPIPQKNTMSIYIGTEGDLSYSSDDILYPNDFPHIQTLNGKLSASWLPIAFPIEWSLISGDQDTTFTPKTDPTAYLFPDGDEHDATDSTPYVPPYPDGTTASVVVVASDDLPNVFTFAVTATGTQDPSLPTGYGDSSVFLDYCQIDWPALYTNATVDTPVFMPMDMVRETHVFDWNNLNFFRQMSIVADNFYGQWSYSSGMRAVQVSRGWNGDNQVALTGWIGERNSFTRGDPERKAQFTAFDRSFPLRRKVCGVSPPQDAWCIYSAIRFWAEFGGVTDDWLIYLPNCPTGPNPTGCTHPLLPAGTGTRPRMQASKSTKIWDQMNRIRGMYRHIMGFDVNGYLIFQPWDPSQFPYFGAFSTVPTYDDYGNPLLNEIVGQFAVNASVADVRSGITLIGIDPQDWSPIINHQQNDDIIYNPSNPAFLGFPDDWVDIDPVYTNEDFMQEFALLMAQQASIPTVDVSFQAYMQPYLGLLQIASVFEPSTLPELDIYTTVLNSTWGRTGDDYTAQMMIQGKSIANAYGGG